MFPTLPSSALSPAWEASQPMMEWWSRQYLQSVTPLTRFQLAWMECICETLQQEARFLEALANVSQRFEQCYDTHGNDPIKMGECYQALAREVTEQHLERLKQVASLPHDLRSRIWEAL
ncbi:hypothetical protein QPM17_23600 [Marinobacter sp. TBZ242]|uniref:Uncharacterized protein n=1 Tax=Marinobacter azerbaijanicus TaxID=3050455 RepID=A0ABT7IIW2_9GAMM|nr:hypothetical protein [Marinobacter sp. TBZ242]MDL0434119.1 hypothetical protein [Marinobacter sp. TBZ242]